MASQRSQRYFYQVAIAQLHAMLQFSIHCQSVVIALQAQSDQVILWHPGLSKYIMLAQSQICHSMFRMLAFSASLRVHNLSMHPGAVMAACTSFWQHKWELSHQEPRHPDPLYALQVFELMKGLTGEDALRKKRLGVDASGRGWGYSLRDLTGVDGKAGTVRLSGPAVQEGAWVKLHLLDPQHAQARLRDQLQVCSSPVRCANGACLLAARPGCCVCALCSLLLLPEGVA